MKHPHPTLIINKNQEINCLDQKGSFFLSLTIENIISAIYPSTFYPAGRQYLILYFLRGGPGGGGWGVEGMKLLMMCLT